MIGLSLLLLTSLAAIVFVVVLLAQGRKSNALMAELAAGGWRRDAALAALPPKTLKEKLAAKPQSRSIGTMQITLKERVENPVSHRRKAVPFSDARLSRLN